MHSFIIRMICFCLCLMSFSAYAQSGMSADKKQIMQDYRLANAVNLAAGVCLGIYEPEQAPELGYLRDYGWEIIPYKIKGTRVDSNLVIAHNRNTDKDLDVYILGFRGSANKKDWQINFDADKVFYGGSSLPEFKEYAARPIKSQKDEPLVHKGFNDYVDTALNVVLDIEARNDKLFIAELWENPKAVALLTGHSTGGAVATLMAQRLVSMGFDKERVPVITFGAPAIGNDAFAAMYGDKINLWRVTNTSDPIPGSLQTIFGKYKQFGTQYKYHISPKIAETQHDMAMYFDYSVKEYYRTQDAAVNAGLIKPLPLYRIGGKEPTVAVWIGMSEGLEKKPYVPDIKRFLMDEYRYMLPNYIIMETDTKLYQDWGMQKFFTTAREFDADYILIADIDGYQPAKDKKWYINMSQSIFKASGEFVNSIGVSRMVSPASGNIAAAIYAMEEGREELRKYMPWIRRDFYESDRWRMLGEISDES